jgi:hypothetical protein
MPGNGDFTRSFLTRVFFSFIHNCPGYLIYGSQPTARLDSAYDADVASHGDRQSLERARGTLLFTPVL